MAATGNKILIVCSHRDPAARPWQLGFVLEVMDRSPVSLGDDCQAMRDPAGQLTGYRIRCRRCGRAPQLTVATWRLLVDGLDAAGAATLDIAALPF